ELRRRTMDTLVVCERGERELAYVEEHVIPRLDAVAGAEMLLLCAEGHMHYAQLATVARSARMELRPGGLTELTTYDPAAGGMRTRVVPNNPTLPDAETTRALDAQSEATTAWRATFLHRLHSQ